ncbi:MAG: DUF4124 domain-containing protein [Aquabacterium sp.]|nr:DUF4124 domain-containing protein [Aquabacterium sp.]
MNRTTTGILLLGLLASSAALSAVVYRWVDDNGQTHVSDVVPDKYRRTARLVNLGTYEVSPQDRKQAEERAARDKASASRLPATQDDKPPEPSPAASATPARRPSQGVTSTTDCTTWRRLYQESLACFGPYRTTNGGIKPEAFEACTVIPSPDKQCGPRRD